MGLRARTGIRGYKGASALNCWSCVYLEKWYGDVVDQRSVHVHYRANLRIGPLVVGYAGSLASEGRTHCRFVPGGIPLPQLASGIVEWPAFGQHAALTFGKSASRKRRLWQERTRLLTWNPLVLNGPVTGAGVSGAARGYAERLTLNCGPWRLGLERLCWGRYCGTQHSLTWIRWFGRHPLRLALLNGEPVPLEDVSRERIECAGATLRIGARRVLVHEAMDEGALRGLALPRRLPAMRFFKGIETKWFAPAELDIGGRAADDGHAVLEEVAWS